MIQDCLRYWVAEYRVDGFRFDLASILGRNEDGSPMENPPLVKNLAYDSLLADTKLIAEAWGCRRTLSGRKFSGIPQMVRMERKIPG